MKVVKGTNYLTGEHRDDFSERKECPRCHGLLPLGYPGALSRRDNKTEICSDCGRAESMTDFAAYIKRNRIRHKIEPCPDCKGHE